MKNLIFIFLLINFGLFLSCKSQLPNSGEKSAKEPNSAVNLSSAKPSPTAFGTSDCRELPLGISSINEVETSQGKVNVWAKVMRGKDDDKIKNELYYQLNNEKPKLITETRWYGSFSTIEVSPNGKWARATFSIWYPNSKNDETEILIDLKNRDFIKWRDIDKRLDKKTENKLSYNSCWEKQKPATVIYLKTDETKGYLELPDRMPTPRQDLYEAIGID